MRAPDGVIFNSLPLGAGQLEPVLSYQHLLPSLSPFAALEGAAGLGFRLGRGGDPEPWLALSSSSPSPQGMEYSKARGISCRMLSVRTEGDSLQGKFIPLLLLCLPKPFSVNDVKYGSCLGRSGASLGWAGFCPLHDPADHFGVPQLSAEHPPAGRGEDIS